MVNSAKGTDNIPKLLYPGMVWYGRIEKYHVFILLMGCAGPNRTWTSARLLPAESYGG